MRRHEIIAALDAGLLELERQGAVKLPRYCYRCGEMEPCRKHHSRFTAAKGEE